MTHRGLGWRAVSVRQPWAWALVNGLKDIENRSWKPEDDYRGPVVVHASKVLGCEDFEAECREVARLVELDEHPDHHGYVPQCAHEAGGLVGLIYVTGYVVRSVSPWFRGPIGWVCDGERAQAWPLVPWRGERGLWRLTEDQCHDLCVQLEGCGLV